LVQTQPQTAQFLARFFEERGDHVTSTLDLGQAIMLLAQIKIDLMVLDLHFPGDEWRDFLRAVRSEYPELKIVVTSKYPDVEREIKAQDMGVKAFVRQPFTLYWLNRALETVGMPDLRVTSPSLPAPRTAHPSGVHVPVRLKLTLPMLLMTLLVSLFAAFAVSQVVLDVTRNRFDAQIIESGLQAQNWMVSLEDSLLQTARLVTNTQGIAGLVKEQDPEAIRRLILPIAANADEETIEILDASGVSLLSLKKVPGDVPGSYDSSRGDTYFKEVGFVQTALADQPDDAGDKTSGLVEAQWGAYFYVCAPIYDEFNQVVGVALVGRSVEAITTQMQRHTLAQVTIYDLRGRPVNSTLFSGFNSFPLALVQVDEVLSGSNQSSLSRVLQISNHSYTEVLGPWKVREGQELGLLGVALPQSYLITPGSLARFEIFGVIAAGTLAVILVGFYISGLITRPMKTLALASSQVAQGNLEVSVDVKGNDEMAALAETFNYMVIGLQEGIIYRDLLGQTASPLLREQLRQALSSGTLRLEGQEATVTVLRTTTHGFTNVVDQTDPVKVFDWLNEYFSQLAPIVTAHGGVINKFDGDSMTAFFGLLPAILSPKESALAACETALQMLAIVERLNVRRAERGHPPMHTGIAINTGKVIAGGLGSSDRLYYNLIGEAVNTTLSLELLTREVFQASGVLISQATHTALNDSSSHFQIEPVGLQQVRGRSTRLFVYRLLPQEAVREKQVTL
jgi:adenylate cyclase